MLGGRQQQGDGFGQVTDGLVALAEQPFGNSGFLDGPLDQLARFDEPLGTAADQKVNGPGEICGRRDRKISRHGCNLPVGLGGFVESRVEIGEGLHASDSGASLEASSRSPSKRVSTAWASRPFSLSHWAIAAR